MIAARLAASWLALALAATSAQAAGWARPQQPPGQTLPLPPARTLSITTRAGSWISLDVSPDGKTLVFDLLGDLYTLPVGGGAAIQITRGLAFDTQPTFSADGRWIAFVSDRSGAENLWVARPDGSQARQITFGQDDTVLVSPAWAADGRSLFASRFRPDLNNYELWRYGLDGTETLISAIKPNAQAPRSAWRSALGAAASPDGRFLYFARRVGGLNFDERDAWTVVRRDLASGAETAMIVGSGGRGADHETFFRPQVSPDGRRLAYATHRDGHTELRVRDLATGEDRAVVSPADPDMLEASTWQDIAPRYAFTPDGAALVLSRAGGLEQVSLTTGAVTKIPFEAHMQVDVGPSTRQDIVEDTGPVRARLVQAPIASPDGRRIAFSALGDIYVQPLAGRGPARRIAAGFQPAWSPDGRDVLFVSWSEAAGGAVWRAASEGSAPPVQVSDIPAYYSSPVFTPDGAQVLAARSPAAARQRSSFEVGRRRPSELVAFAATGGPARVVASGVFGGRPHFSRDPGEVYVSADDGLARLELATGERTLVAQAKGPGYYFVEGDVPVDDLALSPDGQWLLAQVAEQLYLLPKPKPGATVDVTDPGSGARRLTDMGADFFAWRPDGGIDLSVGARFQRLPTPRDLPPAGVVPQARPLVQAQLVAEALRARPAGALLLSGARALTMAQGDRIIDDADILVVGDRIAAVGPRGTVKVPPGTPVRDLTGKVVLPGFVDEHDHIGGIRREVLSLDDWDLKARLAYGVTTSFDPSTLTIDALAYQDLIDAGRMLGPRLRSTGPAVFSMNRFASLDEVRAVLRRYREAYGLRNLKEYRTGDRRVREWVAIACRELGLQPTTEGASSLKLDLSQVIDGFAGNEHALAAAPLGPDVVQLMAQMHTSYATTEMVTHTAPPGADWFVAADDAQANPKMRRFWPASAIEQKLVSRPWRPLAEYRFPEVGQGAAALAAAGGLVGMGAHGEVPGIGFHWEMQAHVMGGMTTMAVLHAATAGSAETIGRLRDLGTLELGKLADLVILDRDPVADIRNTQAISAVMRGGFLYGAATLAQLWPGGPAPGPATRGPQPEHWLPAP